MHPKKPLASITSDLISHTQFLTQLTSWVKGHIDSTYHEELFASQLTDGVITLVTTRATYRMAILAELGDKIAEGLTYKGKRLAGCNVKVIPMSTMATIAEIPPLGSPGESAKSALAALAAEEEDPDLRSVLERLSNK